MNNDELNDLLDQRDLVISASAEFTDIQTLAIENEQIRELGRIVLETSDKDCVIFSCT